MTDNEVKVYQTFWHSAGAAVISLVLGVAAYHIHQLDTQQKEEQKKPTPIEESEETLQAVFSMPPSLARAEFLEKYAGQTAEAYKSRREDARQPKSAPAYIREELMHVFTKINDCECDTCLKMRRIAIDGAMVGK